LYCDILMRRGVAIWSWIGLRLVEFWLSSFLRM